MLLDELFTSVKMTKKAWVRRDGQLRLVTKQAEVSPVAQSEKPMFPISKPRHGPKPNPNGIGYETDAHEHGDHEDHGN